MTIQLPHLAQPRARPSESAKPDGVDPRETPSEIPLFAEVGNRPGLSEPRSSRAPDLVRAATHLYGSLETG